MLPCDASPGGSANLHTDAVGQTIQGLAVVHFDDDGRACVFTQTSTHVVVDLQGYMRPGAFDDVTDVRVFDSRTS